MNRSVGRILTTGAACILLAAASLAAQPPGYAPSPNAPDAPPNAPDAPNGSAPLLSPDQLDDLVAPIALYPDQLVSQVLVASTYPLELVQAEQWIQRNPGLSGGPLMDAARQQNWDPSVQALVAFPNVLTTLTQDVRWTTDLGNAFLAQQADVMAAVQQMRARAQANGRLNSTPQETVNTVDQGGQSAIEIIPANPNYVYVPQYDPMYVWGPPVWGAYPYLYYPSFGFGFWPGINVGLCFGGWGGWGWGGWGWGWGPNWFGRSVFVNSAFFSRYGYRGGYVGGFGRSFGGGRMAWVHDPSHRLGVSYPTRQLAGRFQSASLASRANMMRSMGSRGFAGSALNRAYQPARGTTQFGGRQAFQGGQSFRGGAAAQGGARSFQSPQSRGGWQSSGSTPRSSAPMSRGFAGNGYAARSYSAPSARSFSAPSAHSFSAPAGRSYSAPSARSFGGGGHAFSGGGGGHAFSGGGGGHSFGGGGGHSFGGGGGHSGGGGGHGRR